MIWINMQTLWWLIFEFSKSLVESRFDSKKNKINKFQNKNNIIHYKPIYLRIVDVVGLSTRSVCRELWIWETHIHELLFTRTQKKINSNRSASRTNSILNLNAKILGFFWLVSTDIYLLFIWAEALTRRSSASELPCFRYLLYLDWHEPIALRYWASPAVQTAR